MCKFCRDLSSSTIIDSQSFKFKSKLTGNTNVAGTKYVEIAIPLKYFTEFFRKTFEVPLTACEINLVLSLSEKDFLLGPFVYNTDRTGYTECYTPKPK